MAYRYVFSEEAKIIYMVRDDSRLERLVKRTFDPALKKVLSSEDRLGRQAYLLSFMGGKLFVLVPESELEPEVRTFYELGGETGLVVPGCLIQAKNPEELPVGFWKITRDGNFRLLTDYPQPADVYRRYACDPERRYCYAVVRFDTVSTLKIKTDPLFIPDHLQSVPGSHFGISGVVLYEILSF